MEIDEAIYSPESGTLRVKCSGEFGLGADGNPSGELLTRTIRRWVSDHKEERGPGHGWSPEDVLVFSRG